MNTNKELAQLSKDLELPRPADAEPFDCYAYNWFAHQAARLKREFQTQVDEAERLYKLALEKSHTARAQEATR